MKKLFAILLAVMLFASMATVASAETTTLTTTVPAATYTLNIPADQEIPFGATATDIGSISVTNASGFAKGKNLKVTVTLGDFSCEKTTTTIPFTLRLNTSESNGEETKAINSGDTITFAGQADGSTLEFIQVKDTVSKPVDADQTFLLVNSADWGKALAGEYTATITFTAEVVVE